MQKWGNNNQNMSLNKNHSDVKKKSLIGWILQTLPETACAKFVKRSVLGNCSIRISIKCEIGPKRVYFH